MKKLNWNNITSISELEELLLPSATPALFFKHSTRCSISSMVLNSFENNWSLAEDECRINFIDLLRFRDVSNMLANRASIRHESPQVIVIKDDNVIYNASHSAIDAMTIQEKIKRR